MSRTRDAAHLLVGARFDPTHDPGLAAAAGRPGPVRGRGNGAGRRRGRSDGRVAAGRAAAPGPRVRDEAGTLRESTGWLCLTRFASARIPRSPGGCDEVPDVTAFRRDNPALDGLVAGVPPPPGQLRPGVPRPDGECRHVHDPDPARPVRQSASTPGMSAKVVLPPWLSVRTRCPRGRPLLTAAPEPR